MVSDHAIKLCQETRTVSNEIAKDPSKTPLKICEELYGHHKSIATHEEQKSERAVSGVDRPAATAAELENARQCGKWGPQQPSEYFLQVYHDVLATLDADPLGGMVSPPLIGSYGTMPLTIIAPLADIVRHMSNLIVRAEHEVILITCSWSPSVAQALVKDALVELSARAGKRKQRVTVKLMYDKAGPAQFVNNRQQVKPDVFAG